MEGGNGAFPFPRNAAILAGEIVDDIRKGKVMKCDLYDLKEGCGKQGL